MVENIKTKKQDRRPLNQKRDDRDEFEEKVIQIDRITRVVKGGRRLRFRAIVVVGDGDGKVGLAVEKSSEVVICFFFSLFLFVHDNHDFVIIGWRMWWWW